MQVVARLVRHIIHEATTQPPQRAFKARPQQKSASKPYMLTEPCGLEVDSMESFHGARFVGSALSSFR